MTRTTRFRRTILQLRHIFFTDALTFMLPPLEKIHGRIFSGIHLPRQTHAAAG